MNAMKIRSVPVGECVEPIQTWNPARDWEDGTFRYIDISSVSQSEKKITLDSEIPTSEAPSRARQLVRAGDVLVSTVRPNLNAVAFVPDEMDAATASTGFCVLRPDNRRLSGRYLFHWVQSQSFVADMVKQATGQSYPAVSDKIIKQSGIPLPPLDEQKRIAAILDQADELRRLRQRAIDRLNDLGQAIFYEMFGDPASNPMGRTVTKLEAIVKIRSSLVDPKLAIYADYDHVAPEHINSGSGEIDQGRVRTISEDAVISGKYEFDERCVLYSKIRPYLNKVALPNARGLCSADMYALDPVEGVSDRTFLKFLLMSEGFLRYTDSCSGRANIPKINRKQLMAFDFSLPGFERQQEFARQIEQLIAQTRTTKRHSELVEDMFSSLQYQAFRGEL